MAADAKYRMSAEKKNELTAILYDLETNKMKEIAEQIKEARSYGDLSENSEYDEAKDRQGKLAAKIEELKDLIANAVIVEKTDDIPSNAVTLGSIVEIKDLELNETEKYEIVGSQEANPREGRISDDSPLGKALHAHVAGDKVSVEAPEGVISFEIVSVLNK